MCKEYLGKEIKKLGFGFMRLPMMAKDGEEIIDMEQTKKMVDHYMEKGFTYFDTAYFYHQGNSEIAINEAVVSRYPRENFQLATKLPLGRIEAKEDLEMLFETSMNKTKAGYYDFYLLHGMGKPRIAQCDELGIWDFMKKLKADGKVKHIGFSFHDTAEVLEEILSTHKELEFVQLQINYADWENEDVQSRKCYEVAQKYNVPVIVMEPVKGGTLVQMPENAEKILKDMDNTASIASWAVRYVASLDNIITVLSGMSNMEQLVDNVSYMENFVPVSETEKKAIEKVVETLNEIPTIPCTDCKYCTEQCPMQINIPKMFKLLNVNKRYDKEGQTPSNIHTFKNQTLKNPKPSSCIACGACEAQCPQHIEIIKELANMAVIYEN